MRDRMTSPTFIFSDSRSTPWLDSKLSDGIQVKNLER